MKTTHREIEIEYSEQENKWVFTLRGRERKVESLAKAKEAIDTPVKDPKPEFKRQFAYYFRNGYRTIPEKVEITSITDVDWRGEPRYWIVDANKKPSKESCKNLFALTDDNAERIARIKKIDEETEALYQMRLKLEEKLTAFKPA